ncbi:DEK C-terminal [Arabidopsis thaliana x Arabidopsis arenosa]|uniref:DEK C-terminal n=1 Tax=Arabidopsis thaliana x Arabidopsis arenosa TaxID=1240361 RepID=A0A8T1ZN26_9BRAS|nr:DEK C-terminal [Arabidopsis thaliana x Arabidopsis arenosa]
MATETLELKTPELADTVAVTEKDTEKKEAPVTEDTEKKKKDEVDKDEAMKEKGEENDGERIKSPVTPVSERPIRERKRTGRYIIDTPSPSSVNKPVLIEQGRGTRLREIPNVAYKLSKRKPDDNLFLLHTILYGKKGKAQMLKKNIGQFSGFVWSEQEEEKQRARAKEKLEKCIKEKLIDFCDVLDIPINKSTVKKEELAVRVLEFLVCPKATRDILLADSEKETKKRKKSTPKNVTSGESSDLPAKRRRQAKNSGKKQEQPTETEGNGEADVGSEGTNDSHGEDDVAPEEENNKNEDTETEDEKDKAKEKTKSTDKKSLSKRTKKEKPAAEEEKSIKGSAKSSRKSSRQIDKSTSSSSKKQKVDKDDSSKEKGKTQTSKPQAKGSKDQAGTGKSRKKGKKEPTKKELHVVVAKILKEVDFNTATLSDILRKLGNHFGVDLMHRKAEVKDIITDAINEMSDDDEKEENTEDEGEK